MKDAIQELSRCGILMQPGAEKVLEEHESPGAAVRFIKEHYLGTGEPVLVFPSREELIDVLGSMSPPDTAPPGAAASKSVARAIEVATLSSMSGQESRDISREVAAVEKIEQMDVHPNVKNGIEPEGDGAIEESMKGSPDMEISQSPRSQAMLRWKPSAREFAAELRVDFDITGNSTCTGIARDFENYFSNRFESLKEMIKRQHRRSLETLVPIRTAFREEHRFRDSDFQIIGIVRDVRTSSRKNVIVQLEDDTGEIRIIIREDVAERAGQIVPDEVIAIHGRMMPRTYRYPASIIAGSVIRPDIPESNRPNRADVPLYAAFMSDIHIGSNTFLHKQWDRFIRWINGRLEWKREIAADIKYLVIAGDMVDGIGVYPGQEDELDITSIFAQYEDIAQRLADIPEHIKIIISPGNHDAVRMAEPQPAFFPEIAEILREHLPDASLLGNPCRFGLHGVNVLAYHGKSMDDYITTISHVTYDTPLEIMKEMLKRRHLVPIYGKKTPIAPEEKDHLVIGEIPDIFVTGHVHSAGIDRYRGVLLLNASTWQDQTSYQRMMNFVPDFAKLPVVNLQTLRAEMLNFNGNMT